MCTRINTSYTCMCIYYVVLYNPLFPNCCGPQSQQQDQLAQNNIYTVNEEVRLHRRVQTQHWVFMHEGIKYYRVS